LESFYHGTSSGIDPLNSYLKKPLLFSENKYIQAVDIHLPTKNPEFAVFLINTRSTKKTGPLVNIFLEKVRKKNGQSINSELLNSVTNKAINSIIKGNNEVFFESLKQLSSFQMQHFDPMIPEGFRSLWKKGLEEEDYYLKLCGSGGGGFLLGFTNDFPEVRKKLEKKDLEIIPVYVHHLP
jgi:mevalonate kinase